MRRLGNRAIPTGQVRHYEVPGTDRLDTDDLDTDIFWGVTLILC